VGISRRFKGVCTIVASYNGPRFSPFESFGDNLVGSSSALQVFIYADDAAFYVYRHFYGFGYFR
jgi:hypothetical protein